MSNIKDLADLYNSKPNLQKIIQTFGSIALCFGPAGIALGSLTLGMDATLSIIGFNRAKKLYDKLASGEVLLTDEIIKNEVFIHNFIATTNIALRTRRHEKIVFFANLLINGIKDGIVIESKSDEYEKYLKVLDELEYSEIVLLHKMYELEIKYPCKNRYLYDQKDKLEKENVQNFSKELREFFKENYDSTASLESSLKRIERTGCFIGSYTSRIGANNTYSITGELTILFRRLRELIQETEV